MKIRKFDRKAITSMAAVAVALIIVVGMGVAAFGYSTNWKFQTGQTGNPPTGGAQGSYTVHAVAYNSLNMSSLLIGNTVNVYYYSQIGGVWNSLMTATTGAYDALGLTSAMNGYIYAVCTTNSTYYLDAAKIALTNNILTYVGYEQVIGGASIPQWVFKINMNGIVPGNRATADITLTFYAIGYDSGIAFNPAQGGLVNCTGVGTALNYTYLYWAMSDSLASEGVFVRQIVLSTNDIYTTNETLMRQNIPGVGNIVGGSFQTSPQASAIVYTWNAPTNPLTNAVDLGTAIPWTFSVGNSNKFDLQTSIQTTLTAASTSTWTITVYWLTPAGVGGSATQQLKFTT